jgi:hypothetical protein
VFSRTTNASLDETSREPWIADRAHNDRVHGPKFIELPFRHEFLCGQVVVGAERIHLRAVREIEKRRRFCKHLEAFRSHFGADAVAGDDGDGVGFGHESHS